MNLTKAFPIIPVIFLASTGAQAAIVTFENYTSASDNDYTNNFRGVGNPSIYSQTNNGAANDYLLITQATGNASTAIYDQNGSAAGTSYAVLGIGDSLTVSATLTFGIGNASFGFYFINALNETSATSYLALLNVDYSTTAPGVDQFRFATNANATSNNGSVSSGTLGNQTTVDAGITTGAPAIVSATYTILSATQFSISMSVDSIERASATFTGTPHTNVEIGFRTNPTGSNNIQMDNFTVPDSVPEPSGVLVAALSAVGFLGLRRRG